MVNIKDAVALSQCFQKTQTTPLKVLEESLSQMSSTSSVFIQSCQDRAILEAKLATARWQANSPLSLFDGIPISWKDLFDLRGYRTTAGSIVLANSELKTADATVVAHIAQKGLVSVGKTNLSEFAYSGFGLNPHFGHPKNIYDAKCISGGSSSGAALSVAHGCVPLAMGTDTGGSVRIPAALNGLVGYRSSHHRYSHQGVFELSKTLDTLGPITHSVRDCIVLDELLTGHHSLDFPQVTIPLNELTFVVDPRITDMIALDDSVQNNFQRSVDRLKMLGCRVVEKPIDAFTQAMALIQQGLWLGSAEAFTKHESLLNSPQANEIDQRIRQRMEMARHFPASKQIRLYFAQQQLMQDLPNQLKGCVLLTPTVAHTAPEIEPLEKSTELFFETNMKTLALTMPGSFLDMPAVTLPNGFCERGLPTGLLVSTYSGNDEYILSVAHAIEASIRA
ncbi:amidase family protein [Acinetobacter rathckeae]|uniref:amidase family protein n=1 Tax=Acinetobacter rathckeae TaxID=2605272 RepID=UPI001BB2FBCF|nr:amidase family protein [Acinetobacter rathckeae]